MKYFAAIFGRARGGTARHADVHGGAPLFSITGRAVSVLVAFLALLVVGAAAAQESSGEQFGSERFGYLEGRIVEIDARTSTATVQVGDSTVRAALGYSVDDPLDDGIPRFSEGDRVEVYYSPGPGGERVYAVSDWVRRPWLLVLTGLFLVVSVAVARFKGLRAFVATGTSLVIVIAYIVPTIIAGHNPVLVSLLGVGGILVLAIYFVHGVSWSTSAALIGTFGAIILTLVLGLIFTELAHLTGFGTEEGMMISFAAGQVNLKGLLLAGLLIGALGALTDITIVQASVVRELAHVNPEFSVAELYKRGMNVGLDHIGSLVNTLVLAYTGSALPLLVLLYVSDVSAIRALNLELVAAEVVHTLVGSIGLVLAVPFTTLVAAAMFRGGRLPVKPGELEHGHHH